MRQLVMCPCTHPLDNHSHVGCSGATFRPGCSCERNPHQALEAAIAAVVTEPWRGEPPASAGENAG